jgi:hypothetical protein
MDAACPDCGRPIATPPRAAKAMAPPIGTRCLRCGATVPPMDAICPDCGPPPPPRYALWHPPAVATTPARPGSTAPGPYRTARVADAPARIVTGTPRRPDSDAPPVVLLTADTVEGLGSVRRADLRQLTVEPDLGAARLVAEAGARRVILARGGFTDLETFARQLASELAVPVATLVQATGRPGPRAWTRTVDSTGTIALTRNGRGRSLTDPRAARSALGRDCLWVTDDALAYTPHHTLALATIDYFDLATHPDGDPLRAVMARGVAGQLTRVFTGPAWVAAELCARLAVELTHWRLRRHAARLPPAP